LGAATPDHWWHVWRFEPWLLAGIGIAIWTYVRGVRALDRRRPGIVPRWRRALFGGAIATLVIALVSPLDGVADALFSVHMVQHLLLILVAAPLFVAGAPFLPFSFALPTRARRALGRWYARTPAHRVGRWLTAAPTAWGLHAAALWYWHIPGPYQAAVASPPLHAFEHLCFFGTAILFWWPLLAPFGRRLDGLGAVVYAFTMMMQGAALGAALTFASAPWYPIHADGAAMWGITLLDDQQMAGLIMWVPAGVVYVGVSAWLFVRWLDLRPARRVVELPL